MNAIRTVPTILCYALNKLTHIHTIVSYKIILIGIPHQDNHTIVFSFLTQNTNHHFSLISLIASKILTSTVTQMYIFCPFTKTFNAEESRPFLIPHEFIQPIEIPILKFILNTKYNHKIYNLIQNTPYEFVVGTEELRTIKALQLLWPLLQTKNIIRILAKLLTTSDMIHDIFPHGFFPDD